MERAVRVLLATALVFSGCSERPEQATTNSAPQPPATTCLVLSVGGEVGLAHIGAIDALKQHGVQIDYVYGNSMGSLVGCLYATAPAEDLTTRYRSLIAEYSKRAHEDGQSDVAGAAILGAALVALSGGTAGWILAGGIAGGSVGVASFKELDPVRFQSTLHDFVGGLTIDATRTPFATSHLTRDDTGLHPVTTRDGDLAEAVAASVNNPLIWKNWEDPSIRLAQALDPGGDRVSATPVDDALNTFQPSRIIAINVTGRPAYVQHNPNCSVIEVAVNVPEVSDITALFQANGPEFERVYRCGYDAVVDTLSAVDDDMAGRFGPTKFDLMLRSGDFDKAYAYASNLANGPLLNNAEALNRIAWSIVDPANNGLQKHDYTLALKTASRADDLTNHKVGYIIDTLAQAYFDTGKIDRAIELQEEAVKLSEGEWYETIVRSRLDEYRAARTSK